MLAQQSTKLDPAIFRAYDIRGIVHESLTEETVTLIGKAIGTLVQEHGEKQIVVARDGRFSGPTLSNALCAGILSTGCNVVDLGMVPTPLLYYATYLRENASGVMLTGSHNPPNYNGLKIVIKGAALTEEEIQQLYQRIVTERFVVGSGQRIALDIVDRYIQQVCRNVVLTRPLSVVIDAGNGVTGMMAPALFRALGCEVHELFCEVDGNFPNHHPDTSQAENLQDLIHAVREREADIGLAFDGDGDRLGVVTSRGEIVWPDRVLMLYAKTLLAEHPQAKIVFDVKCTTHLADLIQQCGGESIMWRTGHSLIKAKMQASQALLGGEMSGHFFFKDRWYGFDDALYAGARLLEIIADADEDSGAVFARIPNSVNTPELKVSVSEAEKFSLMEQLIAQAQFQTARDVTTIDGLRVNFAEGWGLLRPSNTTPYLVLRFEAVNAAMLEEIQKLFRNWMLSVKPDLVLPF